MKKLEIREFLDLKSKQYNSHEFIGSDPVQIPHLYQSKADREISGFLAATIAWGQRPVIIRNAHRIMEIMNHEPYRYISGEGYKADKGVIYEFCHRTFNGEDLYYFFKALNGIYKDHGGIEKIISKHDGDMSEKLSQFRKIFFSFRAPQRTSKHVSDPLAGSAAKRLNMYLRWMVRNDKQGVDFGIWKSVSPAELYLPLDVHTGNVARKLGLLTRSQNDWKAVDEVTRGLRELDRSDPVKYDFALFGLGIFEGWK